MASHSWLYKYPAVRVALLFVAGILIGTSSVVDERSTLGLCGFFLTSSFLLLCFQRRLPWVGYLQSASASLLCVAVGAGRITMDGSKLKIEDTMPSGAAIVLYGTVIEVSGKTDSQLRCILAGDAIVRDSCPYPISTNVVATIRRTRRDVAMIHLRYGMMIACRGVLSGFPEERNPGEFNMRSYYEALGVSREILVRGMDNAVVLDSIGGAWYMRSIVDPVRNYILDIVSRTVKDQEGEFLKGILIGERSGISPSNKTAFAKAGVAHVLAVSGSNVAVVAATLLVILEFLRISRRPRIVLASVGLLLFMMLVNGNQAPVVRATIMALVLFLGSLVQEKPNVYNSIAVAAVIILMADGRQLFDVGFQLSFVAALSIIHLYPILDRHIGAIPSTTPGSRGVAWILRVCAVSAAAMLGTLPVTALYFGRVSIIGLLANIVVVPLVGASVVVGFISVAGALVSFWLAEIFAAVNFILLRVTLLFSEAAGGLPFATFDAYRFRPIDALPYYSGLLLLFHLSSPEVARRLLTAFLVALNVAFFLPSSVGTSTTPGRLRASFVDVGQGDAVLIELPGGKTMLVDGGPRSRDFDAGDKTVSPFLKRKGISVIDLLVISHPDADHIGGIPSVLRNFTVRAVLDNGLTARSDLYQMYLREIERTGPRLLHARAGMKVQIDDDVSVDVLSPFPVFVQSDTSTTETSMNNASVVLKLEYGRMSFLLAGDAGREAEEQLVASYGDFLKTTVLKAGHHGSRTSNTEDFLHAVQPAYAVVSVGKYNRFSHPSPDVLQRLNDLHTDISRTDEEGAVVFESDGTTLWRVDWR